MCAYGLALPDGAPLQRTACLLVSHADMRSLSRICPGHKHPENTGIRASVQERRHALRYPPAFIRAVLRSTKSLGRTEALLVQAAPDRECLVAARVQQLNEQKREQMMQSLLRLHKNLGHPSCASLARVLKHGGASQQAIDLAREVQCEVCKEHKPPSVPPPAQTHRSTHFNQRVGLDVKYLPGGSPTKRSHA